MSSTAVIKRGNNSNDSNQLDQNQLERIFRKRLCRICRCGDLQEKFVNACKCLGPFAWVHKQCFEHWIEITKQTKCDICRFDFNIVQHNRTFIDWIKTVIQC